MRLREWVCLALIVALYGFASEQDYEAAVATERISAERDAAARDRAARAKCEERDFLLHREVAGTLLTNADGQGWKLYCAYRFRPLTPKSKVKT